MKGAKVFSNFGDNISTGGTRMVTLFLMGGFRIIVHLDISGSWSFRIRIVFFVAVAVIIKIFPFRLLSSPVDNAIAGRKADLDLESLLSPQLATANEFCYILIKTLNIFLFLLLFQIRHNLRKFAKYWWRSWFLCHLAGTYADILEQSLPRWHSSTTFKTKVDL